MRVPFQALARLPSIVDATRLVQELLLEVPRGDDDGPYSALFLNVIPRRMRVSKQIAEEVRSISFKPITVESDEEVPPAALNPEEVVELIL